jgi:hypothetical protein
VPHARRRPLDPDRSLRGRDARNSGGWSFDAAGRPAGAPARAPVVRGYDPAVRLALAVVAVVAVVAAALIAGGSAVADDAPPPPVPPAPGAPPPPDALPARPAADPAPAPRATFDREEHDFGIVRQNDERRAEFRLTNAGDAPLLLLDVRADCGCAAASADGREVAPGATTSIHATMRSLTMSGALRKRVIVKTNDPKRPVVELGLKMDIAEGIVLTPARFYFGDVAAGTAPSATMRAQWKDGSGKPFAVTAVEAPGMELDFATKRFDEPPWHGWEVTATFRKPPPVGVASGTAILRTDDPERSRLTVPVQAFVSGKVWVDRRTASLGLVPAGKGREIAVGCKAFGKGVDLGAVTAKARKGRVEARAVPSGREWIVLIRLPPDAPAGRVEDVVDVVSSIPGEPPAEIVVSGEVLGAAK